MLKTTTKPNITIITTKITITIKRILTLTL
jgi:hypothetical protein